MRTAEQSTLTTRAGVGLAALTALLLTACTSDETSGEDAGQEAAGQEDGAAEQAETPQEDAAEEDGDEAGAPAGDACELLTEEQIEEVFGSPVQEGIGSEESAEEAPGGQDAATCLWQGEQAMVSLTVFGESDAGSAEEVFEMTARPLEEQDVQEVDIADEALWIGEGMLLFREGETVYMLSLGAVELEQAQALAELIIES